MEQNRPDRERRRSGVGARVSPVRTRLGGQLVTMAGKWRRWEEGKGAEKEALTVVGYGLRGAKLPSLGERDQVGSRGQGSHSTKKKSVRFTFGPQGAGNRAAREPAARASLAAAEVKQLETRTATPEAPCDPVGCWAALRSAEHRTEKLQKLSSRGRRFRLSQAPDTSAHSSAVTLGELHHDLGDERSDSSPRFAEDSSSSPPPYLNLINNFFKPEKLTKAEMRFKEKTVVEMMKLNKQIKQAQIQQEPLMEETRQLYSEKLRVQAENKFFLEYLTNKTEECRRQPEELWKNYLQKSGEIERRRQESASKYAKQTSVLKTELLQKEMIHSNLKQQLQALRDVSILKEKQEREIQTLQAETAAKKQEIQVQFLQEKALLEKQLTELDMRQLGKRKRKELNGKTQPLELAAKQYNFEFYHDINRENQQLQKELLQLNQQCQDLQASQSQLKNQKQQLQQEQWYVECLIRGRQRLQGRHKGAQKDRVFHRPHQPLL